MVGRDINWINLRWFNLGTGAESMTEIYFTVRGFEVCIIRIKSNASSDNTYYRAAPQMLRLRYDEF
jgi:hypothetical protein